ncbi:non-structural maintenance of chromosomes element 3 homolog isoform X2 [Pollicipes pollicipes]|uniref:non-structural maintenance of chromosomes element 3 homolog isoform X2 n=1 Tax=Pollicipes pollicipes TaxID=41117 RepID=UPI001884B1F2|nr:non-structural maintenance of chromosomes element 3 homolog isoform X2 [Pollicipes pollicipes]XP_037091637.1 non-structural maintenance of chromosomes element 3 homolog isoform X2 [Pollicipes pollicipes]XP_037091638.1 non-structural maintenance of chromosomes element 3 homolog isoform X2 [Pollicipes pollicipes]
MPGRGGSQVLSHTSLAALTEELVQSQAVGRGRGGGGGRGRGRGRGRGGRGCRAPTLSEDEASRLAAPVVRYVLAEHGRGAPILRSNIQNVAVPAQHSDSLNQILLVANEHLLHVFGVSLEALKNKTQLVLVNRLPLPDNRPDVLVDPPAVALSEAEKQQRGLLVVVLAYIFMNNGPVLEEAMWAYLKALGVEKNDQQGCFGNVVKLLEQDLVRARYLSTKQVKRKGGETALEFDWGERARHEMDRGSLLQFVCQVWGEKTQPSDWVEQYMNVTTEQQQQQREQ